MDEKQKIFDEFMEEFLKLNINQKQNELVEKLKSILAYLTIYAQNNNIQFTPLKSREINDLEKQPPTDEDYLEAMMVYMQNIEELIGLIIQYMNI